MPRCSGGDPWCPVKCALIKHKGLEETGSRVGTALARVQGSNARWGRCWPGRAANNARVYTRLCFSTCTDVSLLPAQGLNNKMLTCWVAAESHRPGVTTLWLLPKKCRNSFAPLQKCHRGRQTCLQRVRARCHPPPRHTTVAGKCVACAGGCVWICRWCARMRRWLCIPSLHQPTPQRYKQHQCSGGGTRHTMGTPYRARFMYSSFLLRFFSSCLFSNCWRRRTCWQRHHGGL